MGILEDLWYGSINLCERKEYQNARIKKVAALVAKNESALKTILSDQQKEQYEKLRDCQKELTGLLECNAFAEGFCLAVKIMAEVMSTMEIPSVDG